MYILPPKVYRDTLSIWFYCPYCKAFQYPKKDDFKHNLAVCPYCGNKINYEEYLKLKSE